MRVGLQVWMGGRQWRRLALGAALLLCSCANEPPAFLARTLEDCRAGDQGACELLNDLQPSAEGSKSVSAPAAPTPLQRDVGAILEGMRHAQASPRPKQPELPPPASSQPSGPDTPDSP